MDSFKVKFVLRNKAGEFVGSQIVRTTNDGLEEELLEFVRGFASVNVGDTIAIEPFGE